MFGVRSSYMDLMVIGQYVYFFVSSLTIWMISSRAIHKNDEDDEEEIASY